MVGTTLECQKLKFPISFGKQWFWDRSFQTIIPIYILIILIIPITLNYQVFSTYRINFTKKKRKTITLLIYYLKLIYTLVRGGAYFLMHTLTLPIPWAPVSGLYICYALQYILRSDLKSDFPFSYNIKQWRLPEIIARFTLRKPRVPNSPLSEKTVRQKVFHQM